jgi:ribosome biogenesis GTPase
MDIEKLGFDECFKNKTDPAKLTEYQIARVLTVDKNSFVITDGENDVFAEASGKLMFNAESPLEYPTVGDWVYVQFFDAQAFAVVHEVLPRKSLLKRKTPGKRVEFQLIAANIDTALIIQSLDIDFNLRRLERYLVMANESNICPVVLLSKRDLLTPEQVENKRDEICRLMPDIRTVAFSNVTGSGLDEVKELLTPAKTFCLLGSSGVGKTTLLNKLMEKELFETRTVREKDGKGRHTTARRQLIVLQNGAMIVDTPGMRELGNIAVESGLRETFPEIVELSDQCRFSDCTHDHEESCAVLAALREGRISEKRYQNYLKMKRESAYNEMSYLDKRRKDKKFGKMCKSVMKHKKNRK